MFIYLCNSSGRLHAQKEHSKVRKSHVGISSEHFSIFLLTVEKLLGLLRRRDGERLEVGLPHLPDQLLHLGLPRGDLVLDLLHLQQGIS